ncbi:hypothetical protein LY90DRAFT_648801 [Neocallimastix californiae]|uniref:Coth-domain-containing protein n=1 Tax=Neocallimastix californiae TaxID=1754190 RepID=A0A1Y2CUD0_9FUNG|nr:hypothetical protein LY90DRAFT_648801 [Neocallimastix californiae]|eukprot:ORY50670.1 hypothetical protein LY90DRAFT_648801 [Neocallimastix californiae]
MKFMKSIIYITSLALVASKVVKEEIEEENFLPTFNLASGFYNEKSIKLKINSSDPKATIYYTLDGSIPTTNSTIYKRPIVLKNRSNEDNVLSAITGVSPNRNYVPKVRVKKGNVIRAIAKLSDGTLTNVISGTYFVGLNRKKLTNNLPVVSIITEPDGLFNYENGIYVLGKAYDEWLSEDPENINKDDFQVKGNYSNKGKKSEVPATIQYFPSKKNKIGFTQDLGMRIMGKASRSQIQKSFRLTCREEYGSKNLKYDLIPGNMRSDGKGPLNKYKSFNIRNGGNDFDYTKIRDILFQGLVKERPYETQQSDLTIAFLNGEYWGIYSIQEDYSDHYIANNFDIDKDNVVILKRIGNGYQLEAGDEKALNLFDLKEFAYLVGFNIYICNVDGTLVGNNYSFWRAKKPVAGVPKGDGRWHILNFDTEFSAGLYMDGTNFDYDCLSWIKIFTSKDSNKLTNALLQNPEFKNMFINVLSDTRNIDFELKRVNSAIEEYRRTLSPLIKDLYNRFGTEEYVNGNYTHFDTQVNQLKGWLNGRHSFFMNQIETFFNLKPAVTVSITSNNFKKGSFIVNDGWKLFNKKYEGKYFRENILYLTAKPSSEKRKLKYWKIQNCKFADKTYANHSNKNQSTKMTIGIYPDEGYFKIIK